jgi:flagellar hook-length control protein FliK
VRIALDGSGARVDFQADLAQTRQAIESSLPALASALREAGLTLTGGGVFQQPQGQPSQQGAPGGDGRPGPFSPSGQRSTGDTTDPTTTPIRPAFVHRGLVDLVA